MAASGPASAAPLSAEQAKGEHLPSPRSGAGSGGGAAGCRAAPHACALPAVVLAEVLKAFGAPENAQRLDEARDNACNDMGKMLQFLLPVATQIQQDVIKAYGFSSDGEGGVSPCPLSRVTRGTRLPLGLVNGGLAEGWPLSSVSPHPLLSLSLRGPEVCPADKIL